MIKRHSKISIESVEVVFIYLVKTFDVIKIPTKIVLANDFGQFVVEPLRKAYVAFARIH